jgi:hypothetical protein
LGALQPWRRAGRWRKDLSIGFIGDHHLRQPLIMTRWACTKEGLNVTLRKTAGWA